MTTIMCEWILGDSRVQMREEWRSNLLPVLTLRHRQVRTLIQAGQRAGFPIRRSVYRTAIDSRFVAGVCSIYVADLRVTMIVGLVCAAKGTKLSPSSDSLGKTLFCNRSRQIPSKLAELKGGVEDWRRQSVPVHMC